MDLVFCWFLSFASADSLQQGADALELFRAQQALQHLKNAQSEGPYRHEKYVRLYELIGIANAYLDRKAEALQAFDMVLALEPGYAISYTLSPRVTFLFEQARHGAKNRARPAVHLTWPPDLYVQDDIPLMLEKVADPKGFLREAVVYYRLSGQSLQQRRIPLPAKGKRSRLLLPALASGAQETKHLELFLIGLDSQGNEVLRLGEERFPRRLQLTYEAPTPWYRKWWFWALAGTTMAAATGIGAYLLSRTPPKSVGGEFQMQE